MDLENVYNEPLHKIKKMKKLHLFITLLICFQVYGQVPSSCIADPVLIQNYERDFANMAIRNMYFLQSPDTQMVRIPYSQLQAIMEGMAAIRNSSYAEVDTIFNQYCVHDRSSFPQAYESILVYVDTQFQWTQNWQQLQANTGIPTIDTLVRNYGLRISNFYNFSFGNLAEIQIDSIINIYALMDSLKQVSGVVSAEANVIIGAAGKINFYLGSVHNLFEFYFEFNDCFDGCDNYRKWTFTVDPSCNVTYLGYQDYGFFQIEPLPNPILCNLFTPVPKIDSSEIKIYPNPSSVLYIEAKTGTKLNIYNHLGQLLKNIETVSDITEIKMEDYPTGLYFISSGQKVFSWVKI
jgi:hypothetical protein